MKKMLFLQSVKAIQYGVRLCFFTIICSINLYSPKTDIFVTQSKYPANQSKASKSSLTTLSTIASLFSTFDYYYIARPKSDVIGHQYFNSVPGVNLLKFDRYAKTILWK